LQIYASVPAIIESTSFPLRPQNEHRTVDLSLPLLMIVYY
jgi:hypothetical protein